MAGDYSGPGHQIVSGEIPTVGLRVLTNDLKWGTITEVKDRAYNAATDSYDGEVVTCGWYCDAWHKIALDNGGSTTMNCDRLSTREPR